MFSDKPLPIALGGVKVEPVYHPADKGSMRDAVHEAHAACVEVNPANAAKFKDVLEHLKASAARAATN